ncbi:MAG: GEVED domain-containing protein [Crocinitomicaceae bacterium]|nr:GEVED domain-containing protein [Crocinitomicaceae bacterium]
MKKSNKTWGFLLLLMGVLTNHAFGQTYCTASSTTCEAEIQNVTLIGESNGINNSSGCTPGGYADYTAFGAYLMPGSTYTGTTTSNPQGYFQGVIEIFIDWNQNGDFSDAGESIANQQTFQAGGGVPLTFTISVPAGATLGTTRMRVRTQNGVGNIPPCGNVATGETEDYTIIVTDQAVTGTDYCPASGGCDGGAQARHIANVTYGAVDNTTTCGTGSYSDFTALSADVAAGGALNVIVESSAFNPADLVNVFVDWNKDFDFNDAGENFLFSGNGGVYTGTVNAPANAVAGTVRMRIAYYWGGNGTYTGCGFTAIGEIEDYSINVTAPEPNCIINNAPADGAAGVCKDAILSWDRDLLGSQPQGYKVYLGTSTTLALVSDQDTTSYDPGTLMPNTTYYYSVVAYNATGDATGCDTFSFTTTDLATAITPNPAVACVDETIRLSGTPTGSGGNYDSHAWTGPGAANINYTDTDTTDFTSNTAGDFDLTYTVTDNNGCTVSEDITVSVQVTQVVDVTMAITGGSNPTCAGVDVEFTATGTNEGTNPTYTWRINGTDVANGPIFNSTTLTDGDVVDVVLASSEACIDDPAKVSNDITMTVTPSVVPTITVSSSVNPYCTGEVLNMSASVTNEGPNPTYEWRLNGVPVGTGPTYSQLFQDDDTLVCELVSDAVCATPSIVTDTFFVLYTTYEDPLVELTITQGANPSCDGENIEFTALPTFGGSNPNYEWFLNGNSVATGDIYSSSSFADGDVVSCILTSDYACLNQPTGNSGDSIVSINPSVTPSIMVAPATSTYCEGNQLTLNSQVTNEGSAPIYEWRVNGSVVGSNSSYSQVFADGDKVVCELTSDVACATQSSVISDTLFIMHSPNEDPVVDLVISQGANPNCDGADLEFTANPTFGGNNPSYEWFVNGNSVGTGPTYSSSTFADGDLIACELTSDYECLNQTTANSGDSLISIVANETPTVEALILIGNDTICAGEEVSFGTDEEFTGNNPTYDWTVNGISISTNPTYTSTTLADGDVVQVTVVSDYDCVTDRNAVSQTIEMVVNAIPAQPTITADVDVLTSSADFNNQWQLNGSDIVGAVNKTYTFTQNGDYTVYVVENGCSSDTSDVFVADNVGIEEIELNASLKLYPNPTKGIFTLSTDQIEAQVAVISDLNGKVVRQIVLSDNETKIDISELEDGVYLLTVNTSHRSLVARIVKN